MGGRELTSGTIIGSTRYHEIVAEIDRVEIGFTWYDATMATQPRKHRLQVFLLGHAFDTLGCKVVGLRTDNFNWPHSDPLRRWGRRRMASSVITEHVCAYGTVGDSVSYASRE